MDEATRCNAEGCERPHRARGWCSMHYSRVARHGTTGPAGRVPYGPAPSRGICTYDGCEQPHVARGYCNTHWARLMRRGSVEAGRPAGWGDGHVDGSGYRILHRPGHPNAVGKYGRIAEHRLVMAEVLGRPLLPGENVHHLNGQRADNRPENLELWVTRQPSGQRVQDVVADARRTLRLYGHLVPDTPTAEGTAPTPVPASTVGATPGV